MVFPEHYVLVPAPEIEARLAGLLPLLKGRTGVFCWPPDLFYLTGSNQLGFLVVREGLEPLFLVRRTPSRARAESPLRVEALPSSRELGQKIEEYCGGRIRELGLTLDTIPAREAGRLGQALGNPRISDLTPALLGLRSRKSPWEVECMKKAGRISRSVFASLPGLFRPGMTELGLAGALFAKASELGSQGLPRTRSFGGEMYSWHIVAGKNGLRPSRVEAPFGGLGVSPSFPQGPSLDPIRPGEPIVVDFGVCHLGYHADVTRTYSWGRPPDRVYQALEALKGVEAALLDRLRPGEDGQALFALARETAAKLGFDREFLGLESCRITFVGHGVGLEISEPPFLAQGRPEELKDGQTLALELKMVLPGIGAVGHENTFAVTPRGGEKLSPAGEELTVLG